MKKTAKILVLATSAAALAGCAPQNFGKFYTEAGSEIDGGTFGNSVMNNNLILTGQRSYAIALAERFAADVDETVNFAFDSAQLDAEAKSILNQQANWINQFPEVRFRVFGHTDLVGTEAYNRRLGLRRAQAVVAYLVSRGVDARRLEALSSLGETQPLIQTQGRERRNRRTETQVSGFVQDNPMVLNGKYAEVIFREYVQSATERTSSSDVSAENLGN